MSGGMTVPTTPCRRRTRDNEIQLSAASNMTLRRTTTKRAPRSELLTALALLISCWTIQVTDAITLLNGRYETTTGVVEYLNLALDVSKMVESEEFDLSMDIYKNGVTSSSVTLQSLSLNAEDEMNDNPFYHMFRYAFWDLGYNREGEEDGLFDGSPVETYADTVVQDLFALNIPEIESYATLVMNVWMASVNGVFEAMAYCREHDGDAGIAALDRAVALWVGAGQEEGSNEKGHLLYNMAENAGELFDQDIGETYVNKKVMDGFLELQNSFVSGNCDDKTSFNVRYAAVRSTVYWLTGIMTVPLIQNLIHHTINTENEGGSNMVELFALGVLPRVATCDPRAYEYLLKLDVLNDLGASDELNAIETLQSIYPCLGVTCADVGSYMGGVIPACQDDNNAMPFKQGGYTATSGAARSMSKIDRDILQIDAFLKYQANELAADWYKHGWNSELSLHTLALHDFVPDNADSYYKLYENYFGNAEYYSEAGYLNAKIMGLLEGNDSTFQSQNASPEQVRSAITGLLQYSVMFLNIADSLKYAAAQCGKADIGAVKSFVDASAMFFVGSMADTRLNSSGFGNAKSLFVMAQDLCNDFGTCVKSGDNAGGAAVSELFIGSLNELIDDIDASNCEKVKASVDSLILPTLAVPLVQGVLKQAAYNEDLNKGSMDPGLATGDVLSRSILPLVDDAVSQSANVIRVQMEYQLSNQPVPDGFNAVADAFRTALPAMGISCEQVGVLSDEPTAGALCGDSNAPTTNTGGSSKLAFGRYQFSDPVLANSHAAFALDVRDIFNAKTFDEATSIYEKGANALETNIYAEDFIGEPSTPSLMSLSKQANQVMDQDPMFNIYKYALYDDEDFDEPGESFSYANDVLQEALKNGEDTKLAAEATVVLHVYMAIVNKLYDVVRVCSDNISPELELDSAVALWIGAQQGEGNFSDGWLMYSIAQSVHKFYGFKEEESPANSILMDLFLQAQDTAKKCPTEPTAATTMRSLSIEMIRKLTQPLIQSLIFHMVKNSKNMVELYAVAVIPQCATCDLQAFKSLKKTFFSGYSKESSITDQMLDDFAVFLRCQGMTCDTLATGKNADEDLTGILGKLCDRLGTDPNAKLPIAGYVPTFPVNDEAQLDLDARALYIMMRTLAYEAAEDIFNYGYNSDGSNGNTLLALSSNTEKPSAENLIMHSIKQKLQFVGASRQELAEVVHRTLQSVVSYFAVVGKMEYAVDSCNSGSIDKAKKQWDTAVASFAGSMEGTLAGGKSHRDGIWLYALGNEFCDDFGTCETSGEATVNEKIMFDFAKGRDSMADGQCGDLKALVSKSITPKLLVPHIQGIISSAIKINEMQDLSNQPELKMTAHILTKLVVPRIEALNAASASILDQTFGTFKDVSSSPVVSEIVGAFGDVLSDLGIPCDVIGNPIGSGLTLCTKGKNNVESPIDDNPTILADDLYVTKTYVQDFANIAGDIKDMSEALSEGNNDLAQLIYRKGKNSEKYDEDGKYVRTRSLKWFSTQSSNNMLEQEEPEFIKFMYTLGNQLYADNLVEDALAKSDMSNPDVATEAALVLNLWMEIVHLMRGALEGCKDKQLRNDDGVFLMDAAVAYWIGDGQVAGDGDNGHLLYALSERFGQVFSIDDAGQSRTNTNILRLFNAAKNEVSLPNACSDNQYTYTNLRGIVNKLIPQMAIPLIQGLIYNLRENDRDRVNIYAHAFVPLVAGCRPSVFQALKQKFFVEDYNVVEVESIIDLVRQSFDCLGLTCDDIGILEAERNEKSLACKNPKIDTELAGYQPASDVRQYSRFDLDISEMDILLQMKAYGAVEELYTYGKHVQAENGATASFGQLATTKHRNVVPEFDKFVQYYDTESFADDIIRGAIDSSKSTSKHNWTDEQRRVVIVRAVQVLVTYFAVLQNAYEAVADCRAQTKSSEPTDSWDKAAALLIGSLEGTEKNGTSEGFMLYGLGQEYCTEFGTCVDGSAVSQLEQLTSLLYTGRGAVLSGSCRALEKAADELSSLLLIPIIQGTLSSSTALSAANNLEVRAEAYVYGRALVPFVRKRNAANDIDTYLSNPAPLDKKHTEQKIYAALASAYPNMDVDCEDVGTANGNDTCSGVVYVSDWIWYVVGSLGGLLLAGCGMYMGFRIRRKAAEPENNPSFIEPKGEMNHSMDLLEKAFASGAKNVTPNSSHSNSSDEEKLLNNRKYIDELADDIDDDSDAFEDEDDRDLSEIVALTKRQENQEPDII